MAVPDDAAAPSPDEPTTAGAHATAAADDPALADEEERPASRVGARSPGDVGDVGGTDSMTAETGGLAGTSR